MKDDIFRKNIKKEKNDYVPLLKMFEKTDYRQKAFGSKDHQDP